MMKLSDKINSIVKEHRIDAIFGTYSQPLTLEEVLIKCKQELADYIIKRWHIDSVVVYPGGCMGKCVADLLRGTSVSVHYLLDNFPKEEKYKGIPIISYEDWTNNNGTEIILISATDMHEAFVNQMVLEGYEDRFLDIKQWFEESYCNMELFRGSENIKLDTDAINALLYKYNIGFPEGNPMHLRAAIYGLIQIRDFFNAEKYIEYLRDDKNTYENLKKAIGEIEYEMKQAISADIENIFVMHIIDSLENSMVDAMPWLRRCAEKGIRCRNISSQYTFTEYCINRMFTGKDVFDIELDGNHIYKTDSLLMRYINDNLKMTVVSCDSNILQEFYSLEDVETVNSSMELSELLFRGIEAISECNRDHFIVLHSVGEIHSPFRSVGKKYYQECDVETRRQFFDQAARGYSYVNDELTWYGDLYNSHGIKNVFMGDHGIWTEAVVDYNLGIKKDLPFLNWPESTPAFVAIGDSIEKDETDELISAGSISNIILDLLLNGSIDFSKYIVDKVSLQQVPIYNPRMAKQFIEKGSFAQYEGLVGIRTDSETYLITASGKEMYFRPKESGYRNLINNKLFETNVTKMRGNVDRLKDVYKIYALEKYKEHLSILDIYDHEAYIKILEEIDKI